MDKWTEAYYRNGGPGYAVPFKGSFMLVKSKQYPSTFGDMIMNLFAWEPRVYEGFEDGEAAVGPIGNANGYPYYENIESLLYLGGAVSSHGPNLGGYVEAGEAGQDYDTTQIGWY